LARSPSSSMGNVPHSIAHREHRPLGACPPCGSLGAPGERPHMCGTTEPRGPRYTVPQRAIGREPLCLAARELHRSQAPWRKKEALVAAPMGASHSYDEYLPLLRGLGANRLHLSHAGLAQWVEPKAVQFRIQ